MFKPRKHTHWLFVAFDSKDPVQPDRYFGAVQVDVVAESYDQAYQRAQQLRPRSSENAGWDLKSVVDHLPGHCRT
jgi:hypothetical protein